MLTTIKRGNVEYLANKQERRGRGPKITPTAQAVRVAENVTITTSNPSTFERFTGIKVERPQRKGKPHRNTKRAA